MREHYTDRERRSGEKLLTLEEVAEQFGKTVEEWEELLAEEPGILLCDEDGYIIREVWAQ